MKTTSVKTSLKRTDLQIQQRNHFDISAHAAGLTRITNTSELKLVIAIGTTLWVLVGISTFGIWYSEQNSPLIDSSEISKIREANSSDKSAQKRQYAWRPGIQSSGECGALQDSNMRRLGNSTDINQLVKDAPPGYDTWYRTPE